MENKLTNILLNNILTAIKEQGMREKDCLIKAEINTSYFSDWKAGRLKSPTIDKIFRISQVLGITIDSLIGVTPFTNELSKETVFTQEKELSPDEYALLSTYRDMTIQGKKLMLSEMKYLWADHRQPDSKLPLANSGNCG